MSINTRFIPHNIPYRRWNKVGKIDDKIKYEIASELGLMDKVRRYGWKSLNAKETGKIGGLISKRKRMLEKKKEA